MSAMHAASFLVCTLGGTSAGFVAGLSLVVAPVPAQAGPVMVLAAAGAGVGLVAWLLAVAAVTPALWLKRARRSRRPGRYASCDYDLTGNVSGVCPECGTGRGMEERREAKRKHKAPPARDERSFAALRMTRCRRTSLAAVSPAARLAASSRWLIRRMLLARAARSGTTSHSGRSFSA